MIDENRIGALTVAVMRLWRKVPEVPELEDVRNRLHNCVTAAEIDVDGLAACLHEVGESYEPARAAVNTVLREFYDGQGAFPEEDDSERVQTVGPAVPKKRMFIRRKPRAVESHNTASSSKLVVFGVLVTLLVAGMCLWFLAPQTVRDAFSEGKRRMNETIAGKTQNIAEKLEERRHEAEVRRAQQVEDVRRAEKLAETQMVASPPPGAAKKAAPSDGGKSIPRRTTAARKDRPPAKDGADLAVHRLTAATNTPLFRKAVAATKAFEEKSAAYQRAQAEALAKGGMDHDTMRRWSYELSRLRTKAEEANELYRQWRQQQDGSE